MNRLAYEITTQNPATSRPEAREWSFEKRLRPSSEEGNGERGDERGNGQVPLIHTPWRADEEELKTTGRGERQKQALKNRLMRAVLEAVPEEDDARQKGATRQAMDKANLFMDYLRELREIPHITVADDGEISLYWNGNDATVEVAFPVDGSVEYYVCRDGKKQAGELRLSATGWQVDQEGALGEVLEAIRAQIP